MCVCVGGGDMCVYVCICVCRGGLTNVILPSTELEFLFFHTLDKKRNRLLCLFKNLWRSPRDYLHINISKRSNEFAHSTTKKVGGGKEKKLDKT